MPRSVPEWIGATPDSKAPARVRLRRFDHFDGRCYITGIKIRPGDKWELDHIIALVNWTGEGHGNRESNLAPVLAWAHRAKTRADVKEKARTARVRKKHLGLHKPKNEALSRRRVETDENGNQYEWTGFRWRPVRAAAERR